MNTKRALIHKLMGLRVGRRGAGDRWLREYVKQDPRNLQAYLTLAKSYWEPGQRSGALETFREVIKLSPANLEALQYLRQLMWVLSLLH